MLLALALWTPAPASAADSFGLDQVIAAAQKLAEVPYQEPKGQVPDWLLKIDYDEWRDIRFRPENSLWRKEKLPFEVQFFHPGLFFNRVIEMNVVDAKGVNPVAFSPSDFDYGENKFGSQVPQDLGYAGFRLHYPINKRDYKDEVIVFLGASYFRAVAKGQVFGLSARGLAIDTALPSGEEFPYFKAFWLIKPAPTAKSIKLFALLDSRSVTGAYQFLVKPGVQTIVEVDSRLFFRERIDKLGIAPMTSMFYFGENTVDRPYDYRPEAHDSDGFLLNSSTGEWIWRPANNPRRLNVSSFALDDAQGFGLLQRDRDYEHYQDLETQMQKRPSVMIVPRGKWGEGRAELVEIPTKDDHHDNLVAFWTPGVPPDTGQTAAYAYTMYWYSDDPSRPPGGRVMATRRDGGTFKDAQRFVIDFEGKKLAELPDTTVLRGVVTVGDGSGKDGELLEAQVQKNPETLGWRLTFQVRQNTNNPLELRAFLQSGDETLTETWSYVIVP